MVCAVHTRALQTVTGPQTTVWLLHSVPNCAGVALSTECLVYSLSSFQPMAHCVPGRPCSSSSLLTSQERKFFLSEWSFPPFPLNSRHIRCKFPRQDIENFLK